MTSPQLSVDLTGMAQAIGDLQNTLSSGQAQLQTVDGERSALRVAYQSDQASPILDAAIADWESQLGAVMRTLQLFHDEMGTARTGYSNAHSATIDQANQLRNVVAGQGIAALNG
jgi:hypothetical protein